MKFQLLLRFFDTITADDAGEYLNKRIKLN